MPSVPFPAASPGGRPRGTRMLGCAFAVLAHLTAAALTFTSTPALAGTPDAAQLDRVRETRPSALRHLVIHREAKAIPAHTLHDSTEAATGLDAFGGKLLVVNFWATWCVPCRKEMPALDRLEAALGGDDFAVIAINLDRNGQEKAREFYAEFRLENLAVYTDPRGRFARAAGALGLPATLLVEPGGAEIGRLVGEAAWDAPAVISWLGNSVPGILDATASDY